MIEIKDTLHVKESRIPAAAEDYADAKAAEAIACAEANTQAAVNGLLRWMVGAILTSYAGLAVLITA